MSSSVSVVITSFNRIDLLRWTVHSFRSQNTYPISQFIIVDDSGNENMHKELRKWFPDMTLILNEKNEGLIESIDKAYSMVTSKYIFHSEDDYSFQKPGFIERSIAVMEYDPTIMQVWIRAMNDVTGQPILPNKQTVGGVDYFIMGEHQEWYGFCFQCGLRHKERIYDSVKPYDALSPKTDFLSQRECKIGIALWKKGYRAAILAHPDGYAKHTGYGRSTCGNMNL